MVYSLFGFDILIQILTGLNAENLIDGYRSDIILSFLKISLMFFNETA